MKVLVLMLKSFLHFCTVLVFVSIMKYILSLLILPIKVNEVNYTQVHVEGSLELHSKKSKTLFSFMPEPKAETIPFQTHLNTENYLESPCISIDTNLVKF